MKPTCPVTGELKCKCNKEVTSNVSLSPRPRDTLRKLFTDHAVFTERFIVSFLDNRPETEVIKARLLSNQPEIGDYLGAYVGFDNGVEIGRLLTEHIKAAAGVLKDLKNKSDTKKSIEIVFNNVEEVAKALSGISNGALKDSKVYDEFAIHNEYVVKLAKLHQGKNYTNEIKTYDQYYTHMLSFSDMLCDGLIH